MGKECELHGCKKRKTVKCPYCDGFFCEEHINPYEPEFGRDFNKREVKGHACIEFQKQSYYSKQSQKIIDDAKMQHFINPEKSIEWWINWYLEKYSKEEREELEKKLLKLSEGSLKKCKISNCERLGSNKCPYCIEFFCEKHIDPFESIQYKDTYDDKFLSKIKEDLKGKSHPCIQYTKLSISNKSSWSAKVNNSLKENIWSEKKEPNKNTVNFSANLEKKTIPVYYDEGKKYKVEIPDVADYNVRKNQIFIRNPIYCDKENSSRKGSKYAILLGMFLGLLLLIGAFILLNNPIIFTPFLHIGAAPCGDISSGECMNFKPYFCNNGEIIKNPNVCGCGSNQIIYNNDCIFVCEDGSKFNECSTKNVSYICTNGGLKYSPEKCGCPEYMFFNETVSDCIYKTCEDGTKYNQCSLNKPLFCSNGVIVNNSKVCGCPENFVSFNNICVPVCEDGTKYSECSNIKPLYCDNGVLINKASKCGCFTNYTNVDDSCILIYEMYPKQNTFNYVNNYKRDSISIIVYGGLNNYLSKLPREITYYPAYESPPTTKDHTLKNIDNNIQKFYLNELVNEIKQKTPDKEEQAKIAIRLVQNIPYDYTGLYSGTLNRKYAYEVLYTNTGVCGEKSELLAYILRELGFGVVLFNFEVENHMAVGIKCDPDYDYLNSGYCFIEATSPSMITYSESQYVGVGKLNSYPEIIYINQGLSLNVKEEYKDAMAYEQIINMGTYVDSYYYDKWRLLVNKYGLRTS